MTTKYYLSMISFKSQKKEEFKHIPLLQYILKFIILILNSENEEHYFDLKKLITNNLDIFPIDEAKDIMDSVINYTIQKQNSGKLEYAKKALIFTKFH
ncbi:MAG: hypothetical protein IPP01_03455 [Saprospiraceae bacterium]|nr:hypothetical protein [Saprospiraceae bacterium]